MISQSHTPHDPYDICQSISISREKKRIPSLFVVDDNGYMNIPELLLLGYEEVDTNCVKLSQW